MEEAEGGASAVLSGVWLRDVRDDAWLGGWRLPACTSTGCGGEHLVCVDRVSSDMCCCTRTANRLHFKIWEGRGGRGKGAWVGGHQPGIGCQQRLIRPF